ncbi:hypothetical protein PFY10_19930 [Chryseobacterium daecheongense]|nr:hypothetical protein PFY10_19930 [Chryseobacterium daecheongense]
MKKHIIICLLVISNIVLGQDVSYQGFLPPRMTTIQRDAINPKPPGLMIFNTATKCMENWNSTKWVNKCAAVAPPDPNLGTSCNGFYIDYTPRNGTRSGNINGVPVTAQFDNYNGAFKITAPDVGKATCGLPATTANLFGINNTLLVPGNTIIQAKITIKFNKEISNFKVFQAVSHAEEIIHFKLKNKGIPVSPIVKTAGNCLNKFRLTVQGNDLTVTNTVSLADKSGGSILYNIGGVWFDEIEISTQNPRGSSASMFSFCVGAVK